jgi:hypothetical protein
VISLGSFNSFGSSTFRSRSIVYSALLISNCNILIAVCQFNNFSFFSIDIFRLSPSISSLFLSMVPPSLFGGLGIAVGAVLVALAIVSFIVAYGLLKGRRWAWTITIILSIISIVWNAITIATAANFGGIVSIIISGIIIYYLYRPHVKAYFGKGVNPATPAA